MSIKRSVLMKTDLYVLTNNVQQINISIWENAQLLYSKTKTRETNTMRQRSSITLAHLEGGSGPKCWHRWRIGGRGMLGSQPKCWHTDTLKGSVGRVEIWSKYCCKIRNKIYKLMNFFLNHTLISLNTAPMPQNIFLMIKKSIFW